jgi:hypothetical protein
MCLFIKLLGKPEPLKKRHTKVRCFAGKVIDIETNRKIILKKFTEFKNNCTFATTVPVQHTVRSASGSFFFL